MPGRRWTVLVVPQGSGVSKEVEISSGLLKSIITFGSVLGVMAVASVYIAITWAVDISRVGRLESRNAVMACCRSSRRASQTDVIYGVIAA